MSLNEEDRMTCEVDSVTKPIRFDCEDHETQRTTAEKRIVQLDGMMNARSGWTSRERREMSRERNILRAWLSPNKHHERRIARLERITGKRARTQGFFDKQISERQVKARKRKVFRWVQKFKRRIAQAATHAG